MTWSSTSHRIRARTALDDGLEDNDDCLSPNVQTAGSNVDLFLSLTDPDYYEVTVPANDLVTVDLLFDFNIGEIEVALFDTDCVTQLAFGDLAPGGASAFWINDTGAPASVIVQIIKVADDFVCNNYDMDITLAPDPCLTAIDDVLEENDSCASAVSVSSGLTPGLFVSKTDSDFYTLNLDDGATLMVNAFFSHAIADLDIFLYGAVGSCEMQSDLARGFSATGRRNTHVDQHDRRPGFLHSRGQRLPVQ